MKGWGKFTKAQKATMESRELMKLYRGHVHTRQKSYLNEEQYKKRMGGTSAVRLTIPALNLHHFNTATRCLKELSDALVELYEDKGMATESKLMLMRSMVYSTHRIMKAEADRSYSHEARGYEDFRGAR